MTIETRTFTTKVDNHLYQFTVELNPEEAKAGNFQSMHVLDVKELPAEAPQAQVIQERKQQAVIVQPKVSKGLSNAALDGAMVGAFVSATSAACIGLTVSCVAPAPALPLWSAALVGAGWAGVSAVGCVLPSIVGCGALFHFDAEARNAQSERVVVTQPIALSHTTTTV